MTATALDLAVTRPSAPSRPRRGESAPRLRPAARPELPLAAPAAVRGAKTRSCAVVPPSASFAASAVATGWRLTDRGIAVVLLVATMVAVAAVAVIGLTAARVTADSYQPYGQSALHR